jgi:FkbM family methyltransferase
MSIKDKFLHLITNPWAAAAFARSLRSTYSQYGEDQVFRLLMQPGSQGTFLDVGSHHPAEGSNTYNLYIRGWRGVTIDPNPMFEKEYGRYRPRDTHLVEGVSSTTGNLTYYEFADSRFNTLSEERAHTVERLGLQILGRRTVRCRPLNQIIAEQLAGTQIDLLSVDCEGLDREVLESLDFSVNQPTAIFVEDYSRFRTFREGSGNSELHDYLVINGYCAIAQLAFSALYISRNYKHLFERSTAYSSSRIQGGILPVDTIT